MTSHADARLPAGLPGADREAAGASIGAAVDAMGIADGGDVDAASPHAEQNTATEETASHGLNVILNALGARSSDVTFNG